MAIVWNTPAVPEGLYGTSNKEQFQKINIHLTKQKIHTFEMLVVVFDNLATI